MKKVCIFAPSVYPLFNPSCHDAIGGAETRAFHFIQGLKSDPNFQVEVMICHKEIEDSFTQNGIQFHIYKNYVNSPVSGENSFTTIDADIFIGFGVHNLHAEMVYFAKKAGKKTLLFLASNDDLHERYTPHSSHISPSHGGDSHNCAYLLDAADHILCQTAEQVRLLQQRFNRTAPVIRNPIVIPPSKPRQELKHNVLWIGRSDTVYKRPQYLIKIAKALPHISFTMIMNCADKNIFDEIMLNAPDNVKIIEKVPFDLMPYLYESCDIFINTSSTLEGFPNVFLQAAAHRKLIMSLVCDPDQIFTKHNCGVFGHDSVETLIESIKDFYKNKELHQDKVASFYSYITENHCFELCTNQFKNFISDCLKEKQTRQTELQPNSFTLFNSDPLVLLKDMSLLFINQRLKNLSQSHKVALFPAGQHSAWLAKNIDDELKEKIIFLDDSQSGLLLNGIPVVKTDELKEKDNFLYILSSDQASEGLRSRINELSGGKWLPLYKDKLSGALPIK